MARRRGTMGVLALAAAVLAVAPAARAAQPTLTQVAKVASPVDVTAPAGDVNRVFIVERAGTIDVLRPDGSLARFADLSSLVQTGGERGLLSMAFPPDYQATRRFYVYYTAAGTGALTIARGQAATPDTAAPGVTPLVTIPHDQADDENGGQLQFGPDGMLYAGTGDGGESAGADLNSQDLTSTPTVAGGANRDARLGKLLRLDVSGDGAVAAPGNPFGAPAEDVWALGLRNPFRFSFDRTTGDLVVGDVGQSTYEEVDFLPRGADGAPAGQAANLGWSAWEGNHPYATPNPSRDGYTFPVIERTHGSDVCAITGGYVVRDPGLPELAGRYLYSDFCGGDIRAATLSASGAVGDGPTGLHVSSPTSFGEDACGRVYVTSLGGAVSRLSDGTSACTTAVGSFGVAPPPPDPAPATGSGSGGGGTAGGPTIAFGTVRAQRAIRLGRVAVPVRCGTACTVRVSGGFTVTGSSASRRPLRSATRSLAAGRRGVVTLRFSRATGRSVARALRAGRRVRALVTVVATDAAGRSSRRTARLPIRR